MRQILGLKKSGKVNNSNPILSYVCQAQDDRFAHILRLASLKEIVIRR
jgi:hypothetical protein